MTQASVLKRGPRRHVVLLTIGEAQTIQAHVHDTAGGAELWTRDDELGRAWRVLSRQVEWCTTPRRSNGWLRNAVKDATA